MYRPPSKLLVILLMLFAFVGQTLADQLIITCEEPSNNELSAIVNDTDTANSANTSHINQTSGCCSTACCELDCVCAANTCSPAMYVYSNTVFNHVMLFAESFSSAQTTQSNTLINFRYRPPIFTA